MAADRAARVLMTADTVGGVWTYAVELARELDAHGVQVALATMGAPVAEHQRAQLAGLAGVQLFESSYKLEWMQDCWQDVDAAGAWLLRLEREFQPDLVHLNQYAFGCLAFQAPTLVVAHSCVLSWWRAVHGEAAPSEWDTYRQVVRQGLAGARLVVAPTRAMLDSLAENYGVRVSGRVLPNAARAEEFAPAPKDDCIFAAGRFWDAAKNLAALERVAPDLAWPVKVAGASQHPDGGHIVPVGVHCLGELPRDALARELAAAAIYALPARYEPFGLSVLEAGLSGCALVLGDIASLREIWGDAALYVPPDDHQALLATLQQLVAQPERRARLGAAALERARTFTPARQCEAYLASYARLAPRFEELLMEEAACA
ncbi:MAG TPA: glycosyltransferase family 4 protein [Ramlibacter sp.]|jgi:glycosyltransferase involved in cell wall biosynthesis|nr:glycosyltransferase family 4 protein [Ramlibacter sp.]